MSLPSHVANAAAPQQPPLVGPIQPMPPRATVMAPIGGASGQDVLSLPRNFPSFGALDQPGMGIRNT